MVHIAELLFVQEMFQWSKEIELVDRSDHKYILRSRRRQKMYKHQGDRKAILHNLDQNKRKKISPKNKNNSHVDKTHLNT